MANLEHTRGQRLDQKVIELFPHLSRAFAVRLIEDKKVKVNQKIQTKPGLKLRTADNVEVDYDQNSDQTIPDIEIPIIYEDEDVVVIDKPVGLLTHSKGAFNPEATVATWLFRHASNLKKDQLYDSNSRAGIVHRLDRATSGVMICAKNERALKYLQKQFGQRKTKKVYYAVVAGVPKHLTAVIDMPIERNPKAPATFRVGAQGKSAKTTYEVVMSNDKYSLIELRPETGRTHQLRVHLQKLGHPIIGDTLYGTETAERMYLHAASLEVTIPKDSQRKIFTSDMPDDFIKITS